MIRCFNNQLIKLSFSAIVFGFSVGLGILLGGHP